MGPTQIAPTRAYALFSNAESLHMTAGKLVTGHDVPLSNMEMTLWNTYRLVTARLEQQRPKGGRRR